LNINFCRKLRGEEEMKEFSKRNHKLTSMDSSCKLGLGKRDLAEHLASI
jgi:hypothetical protein